MTNDSDPTTGDALDDGSLPVVVDSLSHKFPDVPDAVIAEYVDQAHATMADAPIQEYVPVLVEHQAQVRLNELEHGTENETGDATGDRTSE